MWSAAGELSQITEGTLRQTALGADGLRLWVALYGAGHAGDVRVGQAVLEELKERLRQTRLSLRFVLGSLHGYEGERPAQLHVQDQVSGIVWSSEPLAFVVVHPARGEAAQRPGAGPVGGA